MKRMVWAIAGLSLAACGALGEKPMPVSVASAPVDTSVSLNDTAFNVDHLNARLDDYFAPLAATSDFSGIIRIEEHGKLIAERQYGFADWPIEAPHDDETLYAGASITKGVLAVLILNLADDEVLSLDDPVHRFLPVLGDHPLITIEAVLDHTAGLPRDVKADIDFDAYEGGMAGWLRDNETLLGQPGKEAYSNVGYALLAQLVETATGESFATLARERVLMPAGMTESFISAEDVADLPKGAKAYMAGPAPDGVATPRPANIEAGASGLVVTARDLSLWGQALAGMRETPLFMRDDPLGSLNLREEDGRVYLSAQGSLPGYAAGVTVWPEQDVTVVYVSNLFNYPVLGIERILRDIVYGDAPSPQPPRPADVTLSERHTALAGLYEHPDFGTVMISKDASGLGMRLTALERGPEWNFYLTPILENGLHWRAFDMLIEAGPDGAVLLKNRLSKDQDAVVMTPIEA